MAGVHAGVCRITPTTPTSRGPPGENRQGDETPEGENHQVNPHDPRTYSHGAGVLLCILLGDYPNATQSGAIPTIKWRRNAMAKVDPQQAADKWKTRLSGATTEITNGVQR